MIKELMDNLTTEQRRQLMHAFEHGFGQYVEVENNHFIGVNVAEIKHLVITESAGNWAYGIIRQKERKLV